MKRKSRDYNGIYQDIFEVLGEEVMLAIYENYRGQQVTFPIRLYSQQYVKEYLKKHYDGTNLRQISRELGYTTNWLQQVIKKTQEEENDKC